MKSVIVSRLLSRNFRKAYFHVWVNWQYIYHEIIISNVILLLYTMLSLGPRVAAVLQCHLAVSVLTWAAGFKTALSFREGFCEAFAKFARRYGVTTGNLQ